MAKVGRNDSCACGSGKKYKKCCMASDEAAARAARPAPPAIDVIRNHPDDYDPEFEAGFQKLVDRLETQADAAGS